ncbi:Bikaverin cluster transcription factor bik5 [Paramyrothecium foliicola]|nr:Bikaverin cluster transcription factor bik5 [Paramyrothecium foliicola]
MYKAFKDSAGRLMCDLFIFPQGMPQFAVNETSSIKRWDCIPVEQGRSSFIVNHRLTITITNPHPSHICLPLPAVLASASLSSNDDEAGRKAAKQLTPNLSSHVPPCLTCPRLELWQQTAMSSPPTITVTGAQPHGGSHPVMPQSSAAPSNPVLPNPVADTGSAAQPTASPSIGTGSAAPSIMPRSCVVCRSRKVRCSRESPCSNCRRAGIPCIFPSNDRPPRWARRLDRSGFPAAVAAAAAAGAPRVNAGAPTGAAPAAAQVMERVHNLENLVKELRDQLDQAHAAAAAATASSGTHYSAGDSSTTATSPSNTSHSDGPPAGAASNMQEQFGRLVVSDDKHSLYVSSGFWSRLNDELDALKMDTQGLAAEDSDSSDERLSAAGRSPSLSEYERTPSERHAFVFRHNLNGSIQDLSAFQPLPFQVSFLVDIFAENVNALAQIVHMPTIRKLVRTLRASSPAGLKPTEEALMFSIYYSAVTAMEEDDILTNFGTNKGELSLKYRLGFEHALAKADFLHVSDLVLVQALCNFLLVGRRDDSPSFIWMMTGLTIRMAQALGMHRDPSRFDNITPYETEIRRRVWWVLCVLDTRSSEDQRADLTIASGSFDTKMPLNLNDSDIDPESDQLPVEREGVTDMTWARICFDICELTQRIVALGKKGEGPDLEEQTRLLNEMQESLQRAYITNASDPGSVTYWAWMVVVRITVAKMTLITHLPTLFASPSEHFSGEVRNKLLIIAIELAEHNHVLSVEPRFRQWRWVLQTYSHWHAIVYLFIEMSRRPWSPIVERAWLALQSPWVIPIHQFSIDKNLRVWVPLRKLTTKAKKHREAELERLKADQWAARNLEAADDNIGIPRTAGTVSAEDSVLAFRARWRKLVNLQDEVAEESYGMARSRQAPQSWDSGHDASVQNSNMAVHSTSGANFGSIQSNDPTHLPLGRGVTNASASQGFNAHYQFNNPLGLDQGVPTSLSSVPSAIPTGDSQVMGLGVLDWLWADIDPKTDILSQANAGDVSIDFDQGMDWSQWVESAQGMEMDLGRGGST